MKFNFLKLISITAMLTCLHSCYISFNGENLFTSGVFVEEAGKVATKTIYISDFEELAVTNRFNVIYCQTEAEPHIEISADSNFIDLVKVNCYDSKLKLSCTDGDGNKIRCKVPINVVVYGDELELVTIAGAGKFYAERINIDSDFSYAISGSCSMIVDELICEDFNAAVAGNGDIVVKSVTCDEIDVAISGSGNVTLTGINANNLRCKISGSGDSILKGVVRDDANVKISGSGSFDVRDLSCGSLSSKVSGSGRILR